MRIRLQHLLATCRENSSDEDAVEPAGRGSDSDGVATGITGEDRRPLSVYRVSHYITGAENANDVSAGIWLLKIASLSIR